MSDRLTFAPLTPQRLADAEAVFNDCGDASRCWCAYWYCSNADYRAGWGSGNRAFFRKLVKRGPPPGLIAYAEGAPAAWCGVAPRRVFDRLNRSRSFAAVDDKDVWSVNCFVVAKKHRRQGLLRRLVRAAVDHARRQGAVAVEAYPVDRAARRKPGSGDLYPGTLAAFLDEGFVEVARRAATRPVVRKDL